MNSDIARAVCIDTGKLVQGDLIIGSSLNQKLKFYINYSRVYPHTVNYFTRKLDKNQKMIFSGDIVRYKGKEYEIKMDYCNNFIMGGIDFYRYCGTNVEVPEMEIVGSINKY